MNVIQFSSGNQQDHCLDLLVRFITIIGAYSKDKLQTQLPIHIMMQCSNDNQQDHCLELLVRSIIIIGAKFMDEIQTELPIHIMLLIGNLHHLRQTLWCFSLMIHTHQKKKKEAYQAVK